MSNKRTLFLMGTLLLLIAAYVAKPMWEARLGGVPGPHMTDPALPGTNSVSDLQVAPDADGLWFATFDYFYTGEPKFAFPQVELRRPAVSAVAAASAISSARTLAQRGAQKVRIEIHRPQVPESFTTTSVVARLHAGSQVLAWQEVAQVIDWSDWQSWALDQSVRGRPPEEVLNRAIGLIDVGDQSSLAEAKRLLERLILKDAKFDRGYIEMARISMKTKWGPEGLRQAEALLSSALQINPEGVNAKILLAYVHAHQGRYDSANAMLAAVSQSETRNLWLWANWGELLLMQGKVGEAKEKYLEAIKRPRAMDTYDRARLDAYAHLLPILEQRKEFAEMEELHKQRTQEYGPGSCFSVHYARFVLQQRGDAQAAIERANRALGGECGTEVREVLGLAHYVSWAGNSGSAQIESLNQARVLLPAGPRALHLMAASDRTLVAAKHLIESGESIDQRDNAKMTALAYALAQRDLAAARRLLRLGARPEAKIGYDDMPVALIPVMRADLAGIRLMQQSGVDYAKLKFQDMTAFEFARQLGDKSLVDALDPKARRL